jgi:uncharacterized protein YecT (DUF1311 family)
MKMIPRRRIVAAVMLVCTVMVCNSIGSQAGKEFNDADDALNVAYRSALSSISGSQERALFIQSQRDWIKYRDDSVTFFAAHYPASKGGLFFKIHLTEERTTFLKSLAATPTSKDPEGMEPSGYTE